MQQPLLGKKRAPPSYQSQELGVVVTQRRAVIWSGGPLQEFQLFCGAGRGFWQGGNCFYLALGLSAVHPQCQGHWMKQAGGWGLHRDWPGTPAGWARLDGLGLQVGREWDG